MIDELSDGAVARIAAMAAQGEVADPALAVQCSVAFLVLPEHVRGSCPVAVRAALDAQAWTVAGWAAPRHVVAAVGPVDATWLDTLTADLAAIDDQTFTALMALAQQALLDALVKADLRVRDAVRASGGQAPTVEPAFVTAWAHSTGQMTAALDAKHREIVGGAATELVRRARRIVADSIDAVAATIGTALSLTAAEEYRKGAADRVDAAGASLGAAFAVTAGHRLEQGNTDDAMPVGVWFPGAAVWTAMSVAGAPAGTDLADIDTTAIGAGVGLGALAMTTVSGELSRVGRLIATAESRTDALRLAAVDGVSDGVVDVARSITVGRVRFRIAKTWQHVTALNYFDPHKSLDGVPAEPEDRFVHGARFPRGGKYRPGDHAGCRCRWKYEPKLELLGGSNG